MSREVAYCYRTGEIGFAAKGERLPDGVKTLLVGPSKSLRDAVDIEARHGHQVGILLVPGLADAYGELEAIEAVVKFVKAVEVRL